MPKSVAESSTSPSETTLLGFKRFHTDESRKAAYEALLKSDCWLKTKLAEKGDAKPAWDKIFNGAAWKCVYCDADLATSTDIIANTTEEHLIPRTLIESVGHQPNIGENLTSCCASCNGLKSDYVPPIDSKDWLDKDRYIAVCRKFVARRRLQNFDTYLPHLIRRLESNAGLASGAVKASVKLPKNLDL